jgi:hypothetical protein
MHIPGTSKPAIESKSQKPVFSGNALSGGVNYYLTGIQKEYLSASYNSKLPAKLDSMLGRLYRDYGKPSAETLHYSNNLDVPQNQTKCLALQRHSLEIQKPTMHLPGCRFPFMKALYNDYVSAEWNARPWDDAYSTYCGPTSSCMNGPSFLNAELVAGSDGNESLSFDIIPFKIIGNGLIPDISGFGDHDISTAFDADDVIHKVYMHNAGGNPAVILDQVCDFEETASSDTIITNDPLFDSYNTCGTNEFKDFTDGYPCVQGYQTYLGDNIDRDGLYEELLSGLGLVVPLDFTLDMTYRASEYLFSFGSGIRVEKGVRFDCGCLVVDCETGTTSGVLSKQTICSTGMYLDENGEYDWDNDHLKVFANLILDEKSDACSLYLNGQIKTFFELL